MDTKETWNTFYYGIYIKYLYRIFWDGNSTEL